MSNNAPVAAAAPSQPSQKEAAEDALLRLAQIDIPAEQRRLKQIKDPTAQQVMSEVAGTQLDIVKDMARNQVELRDWVYQYLNTLSEHVEALEDRIDTIDTYGAETTITPEDAEVLRNAAVGAKWLALTLLKGPFPLEERDEEGKQKLAELIAHAERAERIIVDSELSADDDDSDLDAGDSSSEEVGPS
jgi:hypothetical protein